MAVFDDADDISLIGTGADELCAGRSAIEAVFLRNFSDATATRFEWQWKNVTLAGGLRGRGDQLDDPPRHPRWTATGPGQMDRRDGATARRLALAPSPCLVRRGDPGRGHSLSSRELSKSARGQAAESIG